MAFQRMLVAAALLAGTVDWTRAEKPAYPPARRDATVVDDFHGIKIADPYRWLEDSESAETRAFVEAQNKLTADYVAGPTRQKLRTRYTELFNFPKYSVPLRKGSLYFYSRNDGLQNQAVLYVSKSPGGPPTLLMDPNKLSEDGTVSLGTQEYSHDGALLCYGLQRSGSDMEELHVMAVPLGPQAGAKFDDVLHQCKFTSVAWKHDNSGFFYNRYPAPGTVKKEDENSFNRVYFHKLGTPQSQDPLVYERPDQKEWGFSPQITEDGKYLILTVWVGTDPRSRIYYREVQSGAPFVKLLDDFNARYVFIGNVGPVFYFDANLDAPKSRVLAIDTRQPERKQWKLIVPEKADEVLASSNLVGGKLALVYARDAFHHLYVHELDGKLAREIPLPDIGTVATLTGRPEDDEMFVDFASFTSPPSQMRYEFSTGKLTQIRKPEVKFDPAQFETKQVFYRSKDGTRVPLFIVHRKGLVLDGNNPTLLYGYGGFNVSQNPWFSTNRILWMESGGVFAVACLRGGEEYGEAWHQAGSLANKQNVFDDFIAAAGWLIDNKYTSTKKLAIEGGSNGGLLVCACLVQRPELFGAAVAEVPVTDMLRFHKFTVGSFWVPEYGNPDDPAQFKFLRAYSPLHNLREGVAYPPTLITSADTDDRVVPSHAKKFAAALQHAQAGDAPILLRVETRAGHGGGKPTTKVIEEISDLYAFLFKALGVEPRP